MNNNNIQSLGWSAIPPCSLLKEDVEHSPIKVVESSQEQFFPASNDPANKAPLNFSSYSPNSLLDREESPMNVGSPYKKAADLFSQKPEKLVSSNEKEESLYYDQNEEKKKEILTKIAAVQGELNKCSLENEGKRKDFLEKALLTYKEAKEYCINANAEKKVRLAWSAHLACQAGDCWLEASRKEKEVLRRASEEDYYSEDPQIPDLEETATLLSEVASCEEELATNNLILHYNSGDCERTYRLEDSLKLIINTCKKIVEIEEKIRTGSHLVIPPFGEEEKGKVYLRPLLELLPPVSTLQDAQRQFARVTKAQFLEMKKTQLLEMDRASLTWYRSLLKCANNQKFLLKEANQVRLTRLEAKNSIIRVNRNLYEKWHNAFLEINFLQEIINQHQTSIEEHEDDTKCAWDRLLSLSSCFHPEEEGDVSSNEKILNLENAQKIVQEHRVEAAKEQKLCEEAAEITLKAIESAISNKGKDLGALTPIEKLVTYYLKVASGYTNIKYQIIFDNYRGMRIDSDGSDLTKVKVHKLESVLQELGGMKKKLEEASKTHSSLGRTNQQGNCVVS